MHTLREVGVQESIVLNQSCGMIITVVNTESLR